MSLPVSNRDQSRTLQLPPVRADSERDRLKSLKSNNATRVRTLNPLPMALQEIQGVIGFDAMMRLANVRGGERIYIPAQLPEHHWLIEAIGLELAKKLCQHFASWRASSTNKVDGNARKIRGTGLTFKLPILPKELRVQILTRQGESLRKIARTLKVDERSVSRYRKILRDAGLL